MRSSMPVPDASRVTIETIKSGGSEHGCITVADDGKGFAIDGEQTGRPRAARAT